MNNINFLEPENEKLLKHLTSAFEKEKMSLQIQQMVADKVKLTDFSKFSIPEKKALFWYKNPILNSMLILLGLGLLTTMFYYQFQTIDNHTKQVKTDVTINSHFDKYDINKLKSENKTKITENIKRNASIVDKKLMTKEKIRIESTVTNTETIVNTSVPIKSYNDLSVIKNEIVNIMSELKLNYLELVQDDKLLLIESKTSVGYLKDAGSSVKYRVKFFISKNDPSNLKIDLVYENISNVKLQGEDVNDLFYNLIKNKIVTNIINKYN
jgi:hypothetical protein